MNIRFFNSDGRTKQDFSPLIQGKISYYCCGPTVYNFAHIGNLRTYLFEDGLRRFLEYQGFEVSHVMNITDVGHLTGDTDSGEDKMQKSAWEKKQTVYEIAQFYTDAFFKDSEKLNIKRPSIVCKASDHISHMIDLIGVLEEKGFAYKAGGNVYFDTAKDKTYGRMSLLKGHMWARVPSDAHKKNSCDFALWFTKVNPKA